MAGFRAALPSTTSQPANHRRATDHRGHGGQPRRAHPHLACARLPGADRRLGHRAACTIATPLARAAPSEGRRAVLPTGSVAPGSPRGGALVRFFALLGMISVPWWTSGEQRTCLAELSVYRGHTAQ